MRICYSTTMFNAEGFCAARPCISLCSKSERIAPNNFALVIEALCRLIQCKIQENLFERFSTKGLTSSPV
jgi:hypothetical protein